eukprot:scaffold2618_cov240-Pinguiococcus_pyrenoidosus.AAC.13
MELSYREAEAAARKLAKELVELTSRVDNQTKLLKKKETALASTSKDVQNARGAIAIKSDELDTLNAEVASLSKQHEDADEAEKQATLGLANVKAGIAESSAGPGGGSGSLTERIAQAAEKATAAGSEYAQAELQTEHLTAEQKDLRAQIRKAERALGSLQNKRQQALRALEATEKKLSSTGYDEERSDTLKQKLEAVQTEVDRLQDLVAAGQAKLGRLTFEFRNPTKSFDRSKVKGLVAQLITLREPQTASAIEMAAGGKLYQVVVDTAQTAQALLQRGQLKRRVTIIPLDKINGRVVNESTRSAAGRLARERGGQARVALELVGYQQEVLKAMEYCFGSSFVCDNSEIARSLAFHPKIKTRCVTLDGDLYDPSGAMQGGGSSARQESILRRLQELNTALAQLQEEQGKLQAVKRELADLEDASANFAKLQEEKDVQAHQLQLIDEQLSQTAHAALNRRLTEVNEELMQARRAAEKAAQLQLEASNLHDTLIAEMRRYEEAHVSAEKDAEEALEVAKRAVTAARAALDDATSRRDVLALELEGLNADLEQMNKEHVGENDSCSAIRNEIDDLTNARNETDQEHKKAEACLAAEKAKLAEASAAIDGITTRVRQKKEEIRSATLELQKTGHDRAALQKDRQEATKRVARLQSQHPWIEEEEEHFGKAGTEYDFAARNPAEETSRCRDLQRRQEKLSRKINKKVMGMIETADTECSELERKRLVIESDKEKIETVIADLDVRKNAAVEATFVKVNRDFGSIFSTLLPGTFAKLEPPEGQSVLEGLQVKVAFGDLWKESLSELSGGQRSLLALSLILAMLLFKPAPMYILDEVDAALDLSHTQNIGTMLRTHFRTSQFVVVSLKEGMFNNANIIFRTRFLEGVSTVMRTLGEGVELNRLQAEADAENVGEHSSSKSGRSGKRSRSGAPKATPAMA